MLSRMPENIECGTFRLTSYSVFENKKEFAASLNYFRNFFRSNFGDPSYVTLSSTDTYLSAYDALNDERMMFVITNDDLLVGQYGLKNLGKNRILLDNAVRFSANGPRDLFKIVSVLLIKQLLLIDDNTKIMTAIKGTNIHANAMHSYGKFRPLEKNEFKDLAFPPDIIVSEFVCFV